MYSTVEEPNNFLKYHPKNGDGGAKGGWFVLAILFIAALSLGLFSGYTFGGSRSSSIVIIEEEQPTEPAETDVGGATHYAGGGQGSKVEHGAVGPQHGRIEGPKAAEHGRTGGQKGRQAGGHVVGRGRAQVARGKPRAEARVSAGQTERRAAEEARGARKEVKESQVLKVQAHTEVKKAEEHEKVAAHQREEEASKLLRDAKADKKQATVDEKRAGELRGSPPKQAAAGRGEGKRG